MLIQVQFRTRGGGDLAHGERCGMAHEERCGWLRTSFADVKCRSAEVQMCGCADGSRRAMRNGSRRACGIGSLSGGARRAISGGRAGVTSDLNGILDLDELNIGGLGKLLHICAQSVGKFSVRASITFVARVIPVHHAYRVC